MNTYNLLESVPNSVLLEIKFTEDTGPYSRGDTTYAAYKVTTAQYFIQLGGTITEVMPECFFPTKLTDFKRFNEALPKYDTSQELINAYRPLEVVAHKQITGTWHKCPVCDGSGKVWSEYAGDVNRWQDTCPTCKGHRIISTLNGKPPAGKVVEPVG